MGEAWNPPFGKKDCATTLLSVKLVIRQSHSLQLCGGCVFAKVTISVGAGGGESRKHGKNWVLTFTLPFG